ncbi:GRB2-associated and regulator of MAPK -like [Paramuricea clavata]|uniref:GRB2-associated and regulator of MAPK -like n=1 Tax=Paramuricea clavata TaxID=317549 RepID=A0A6S7FSQ3_PARCT|nr:GRB2-associated and regulator of MAPK -like [Paramuricea clavata]
MMNPKTLGTQLSATSGSNQPVESGSNTLLCNRRPPPVPDRLPLSRNRSAILTNPHLPNNAVAFPDRVLPNVPNNPPQLLSRLKRPHSKTDLSVIHKRQTASTDSQSPTPMVTKSNPALPISQPPSLQANPIQPTSQPPSSIQPTPIQPTSQTPSSTQLTPFTPGQPPSFPTNKMPVPTPEQKEEIYEAISKYPTDLSSLSITDVSALLNYLGMGNYVETFEAELIDGVMLVSMDKESLESSVEFNSIPCYKINEVYWRLATRFQNTIKKMMLNYSNINFRILQYSKTDYNKERIISVEDTYSK